MVCGVVRSDGPNVTVSAKLPANSVAGVIAKSAAKATDGPKSPAVSQNHAKIAGERDGRRQIARYVPNRRQRAAERYGRRKGAAEVNNYLKTVACLSILSFAVIRRHVIAP